MRKLLALVLLLALCGCGGKGHQTKAPPPPAAQGPPALYLVTQAGTHRLDPGSSCVESATKSVCGDSAYVPVKVLYPVRRGETVRLRVAARTPGAALSIGRPGCPTSELAQVRLRGPKLEWRVELRPGDYEVRAQVVHFKTDDGRRGDVSGQIGIRVGGVHTEPVTATPC
jgi:predicted small lipoprotein YifL